VVVLSHPTLVVAACPTTRAAGSVPAGVGEETVLALVVKGLEDGRDGGVTEEDGGSREGIEVGLGTTEREGAWRGGIDGGEWADGRGGEPGGVGPRDKGEGARQAVPSNSLMVSPISKM
jgi:hypothetical protein